MKILVTGGNGYIAKSINNSLSKLYYITNISRADFDLEDTNATNKWF
jgi:dTDP-4-dehydrorhamnose reductase